MVDEGHRHAQRSALLLAFVHWILIADDTDRRTALTRDWNDAFQSVMKELREQILASAAAFAEEGASGEALTAPQLVRSVTSMDSSTFKPPLAVEMLQSGSAIASRRGSGMLSRNKDKKDRRSLSPRSTSPRSNKATTVRHSLCCALTVQSSAK